MLYTIQLSLQTALNASSMSVQFRNPVYPRLLHQHQANDLTFDLLLKGDDGHASCNFKLASQPDKVGDTAQLLKG